MSSMLGLLLVNIVAIWFPLVASHVYLFEPPTRNILASNAGNEQCPHCLQAGGPGAVKTRGGGLPVWPTMLKPESHGLCGDPVQNSPEPTSIQEEKYMEPTSVQRIYTAGSTVEFRVGVSTHHWGHYEFRLCDRKLDKSLSSKREGQDCLNEHVLQRAPRSASCGSETLGDCQYNNPMHPERWYLPPPGSSQEKDERGNEVHIMRYVIPTGLTCEECTLQWYYATGNTCAYDEDYLSFDPGFKFWNHYKASWTTKDNAVCGPNGNGNFGEEFWNCADVKVRVTSGSPPSTPSPSSVQTRMPTSVPISAPEPEPEPEPESPAPSPLPKPTPSPTVTPSPGPSPNPSPTPTPSPTPLPTTGSTTLSCAAHCRASNAGVSWTSKCSWSNCAGCSECVAIFQSCSNNLWATCGGQGWTGATCCQTGSVCKFYSDHYSQCVPDSSLLQEQARRGLKIQRHRPHEHMLLQSGPLLSDGHDEL